MSEKMVTLTQRVSCQSRVEATCRELLRVRAPAPRHACRDGRRAPTLLPSVLSCVHALRHKLWVACLGGLLECKQ